MTSFTNQNKSATSFVSSDKSGLRTFGSFTFDEIGSQTIDGMFLGRPLGDWNFDDVVMYTVFTNQNKS